MLFGVIRSDRLLEQKVIVGIVITVLFLGICTYIDIKSKYVNSYICIIFGIAGVLYKSFIMDRSLLSIPMAILPGIIIMIISIISKESIGKGDAFVVSIMGLYIGSINTILVLFHGVMISCFIGVICMLFMKKSKSYRIPFIPFLSMGFLIQIMNGGLS